MTHSPHDRVRIWSFEHDAWWKPESHGYTKLFVEAGFYTRAEAEEICTRANIACESDKPDEEVRELECQVVGRGDCPTCKRPTIACSQCGRCMKCRSGLGDTPCGWQRPAEVERWRRYLGFGAES